MKAKSIKVILDTNVWISFLIGKKLQVISEHISDGGVIVVTCQQLLTEISEVSKRPKLKKYFPQHKVNELLDLLLLIGEFVELKNTIAVCRDPKDDYLLTLAKQSEADFLITGDNDLLYHSPYFGTTILTPANFVKSLTEY